MMKTIILIIGLIINALTIGNQPIVELPIIKGTVFYGKEKVENAIVQLANNCNDKMMEVTMQNDGIFQFLDLPNRCCCYTIQVKKMGFI